ncbi:MAG: hypothetical protein U0K59_00385, partial [Bacteroidales bacterium]|nr:hypothetical protein [Bacteroidales bacterium]
PLTIPNREVKPCIADDTATPSGKVGRCQIKPRASLKSEALFFCGCVRFIARKVAKDAKDFF